CLDNLLDLLPMAQITLVGGPNEVTEANELQQKLAEHHRQRCRNLVGKLSLEELTHQLPQAHLLLGHDSLVGHLAAYQHVPTFTVGLGTVRLYETIPYGNGNLYLTPQQSCYPCFPPDKCDHLNCPEDISA